MGPIALAIGLGVGIHACAAAVDHAGEYRGPAACSVVDTAQLSALVPRLGSFRAEGVDDSVTVDLTHRVTSFHSGSTRTVHDSDRIGASCTTTDVGLPRTTTTDTPATGVTDTTDATDASDTTGTTIVSASRSVISSYAELLLLREDRTVGIDRLVQIWQDSSADTSAADPQHLGEPNMVAYQRNRTDGRPANCFAAEVVDAQPDNLLVSIDTTATGHCDMVVTLLRAVASKLGPVVTSAPDTTLGS